MICVIKIKFLSGINVIFIIFDNKKLQCIFYYLYFDANLIIVVVVEMIVIKIPKINTVTGTTSLYIIIFAFLLLFKFY